MGKLVFYYGTMGCSKTANALMTRFQYIDRQKRVWLIKPAIDTRDNIVAEDGNIITLVKSRVGIEAEAEVITQDIDLYKEYINKYCEILSIQAEIHYAVKMPETAYDLIICDEAQFLTEDQVEQLKNIATLVDIDVFCYGLRTDFRTKLFPGSKRLFELSDTIIELDNVCECGKPALVNARINSLGKITIYGSQIDIGGDDKYKALCWKCFQNKIKK